MNISIHSSVEGHSGCFHIKDHYSALNRNTVVPFAEMRMDLETVIQSEVSQKNKYHSIYIYIKMVLLLLSRCSHVQLCATPKWYRWTYLQSRNRDTDKDNNGNPLQYSCLENSMGRGDLWAAVHGVTKSWTRLSDFTFTFTFKGE